MRILEIKFEKNWKFENYLRIEILRIKFGRLEFWKLKMKIGVLENLFEKPEF